MTDDTEGLDDLSRLAMELKTTLSYADVLACNMAVGNYDSKVAHWLSERFPNLGLVADWASNPAIDMGSPLEQPNQFKRDIARMNIDARLRWLSSLSTKVQIKRLSVPAKVNAESLSIGRREVKLQPSTARAIVDPSRIAKLAEVQSGQFDLAKLIRMCEELNIAFATESYLSMAMLTRAIVDHVPPIFDKPNFGEVASNYSGPASFRKEMKNLDTTARNIADLYLHGQIRRREVLPTITQVDVSNSLDLLLGEILVILGPQKSEK